MDEFPVVYETDPDVQRALACICYRMLDHVTAEWVDLAPDVLGCLLPIARDLSVGQSVATRYPSPSSEDVPPLLREIFSLRAVLRDSWQMPGHCSALVHMGVAEVTRARHNYRRSFADSYSDLLAARLRFIGAYLLLYAIVIDVELRLMEHQSRWDRVACLLRGQPFLSNFSMEEDGDGVSGEAWFVALSPRLRSWQAAPE